MRRYQRRLATVTPAGLTVWSIGYDGAGRFDHVSRAHDAAHGGGTETTSCNNYDYTCADPIDAFDLDGRWADQGQRLRTRNGSTYRRHLRRSQHFDRRAAYWGRHGKRSQYASYGHYGVSLAYSNRAC